MMFLATRPDFGFGNPNTAAAFFALMAVAVWGVCFLKRSGGRGSPGGVFWASLVLSGVFAGLIVATASRGGLVALAAGLGGCWLAAGMPGTSIRQGVGIAGAVVVLIGMMAIGRMGSRVANSSLEDGSITSRLMIYGKVPAMMVAAPGGWGAGKAAEAYQNWFQDEDDTRTYKHLVSTHATWLVEAGWGLRFGYILGWLVVLGICWRTPAAFGVWVVFGVAGAFSHVGADWRLWVVPVCALAWAVAKRVFLRQWPKVGAILICGFAAMALTAGMALVGYWQAPSVRFYGDPLLVGDGPPSLWFFAPGPAVLGRSYGKLILDQAPAGVVWEAESLGRIAPGRLVLSGRAEDLEPPQSPYDLIWLNPPGQLSEAQRKLVEGAGRKTIFWGELRTDAKAQELRVWFRGLPGAEWRDVPGAGLLLWKVPDLSR